MYTPVSGSDGSVINWPPRFGSVILNRGSGSGSPYDFIKEISEKKKFNIT
jgi:hypothetical protein